MGILDPPAPSIARVRALETALAGNLVGKSLISTLGDSTTLGGGSLHASGNWQRSNRDWLAWAALLSGGDIRYGTNFGVGGETTADMILRLGAVIADPAPIVTFLAGTNDAGVPTSLANYATNVRLIVNTLVAAGKTVIIVSTFPRGGALVNGSPDLLARQYNVWLKEYARQKLFPFLDAFGALTDTTGAVLPNVITTDNLHATPLGARRVGQALVDLLGTVPKAGRQVPVSNLNLIPNPLNLTDTDANGIADNWVTTNLGANAIGSLVTEPGVPGKCQRLTLGSALAGGYIRRQIPLASGFAAGDRLRLSLWYAAWMPPGVVPNPAARSHSFWVFFPSSGISGNWYPIMSYQETGGADATNLDAVNVLTPQFFTTEFVVPAGTTELTLALELQQYTLPLATDQMWIEVGGMSLFNVSTLPSVA